MRPHILVVEDQFQIRRVVVRALEGIATVDQAGNGAEAIEAFAHSADTGQTYDLILLDIHMPVLDGLSALRVIRQREKDLGWKETPVLILSADGTPKTVVDAYYRCGISGYITKPFLTADLIRAVREYARKAV